MASFQVHIELNYLTKPCTTGHHFVVISDLKVNITALRRLFKNNDLSL